MLDILFLFIFFLSGLAILHTYVFFPLLMKMLGRMPQEFNYEVPPLKVAILMSVYNEEEVIKNKMDSLLNTTYPKELLEIWVGSDCSSDSTDDILIDYSCKYPNVHFIRFNERTGKPQIINQLQKKVQAEVLVLTDADSIFNENTIPELVRPFSDSRIGGVQALIICTAKKEKNVREQEIAYNNREFMIRRGESRLGSVISAEGACFAILNKLYTPVPPNFLVDDFFIFLQVLLKGYSTVLNEKATCLREISADSKTEFKRKIRIGSGNYQNFFYFKSFWLPFNINSWVYWSHKVLRWFTPFFLALLLLSNIFIYDIHPIFMGTLAFQLFLYFIAFVDFWLEKNQIYCKWTRFIKHFLFMNLALLLGFIKFVKGIPKSTWDTKN